MQFVKEYLCDDRVPSDMELKECLSIALQENCVVKLLWYFPYNGWHQMYIKKGMTFDECKEKLPKVYGV